MFRVKFFLIIFFFHSWHILFFSKSVCPAMCDFLMFLVSSTVCNEAYTSLFLPLLICTLVSNILEGENLFLKQNLSL